MPEDPDYYRGKTMTARQVIKDFGLSFNLGNVIKYVLRAGKKEDKLKDLTKAVDYLKFEIEDSQRIDT